MEGAGVRPLRLLKSLSLVVFATAALSAAPTITNTALPNPIVGKAVSGAVWVLTATNGTAPYV